MPTAYHSALTHVLQQGHTLLEHLSPAQYTLRHPAAMNATIGGHYRHCLDHIAPILQDDGSGLIDYDARNRDTPDEVDPSAARVRTLQILDQLQACPPGIFDLAVRVHNRIQNAADGDPTVPSSRAREAVFAVSHAVHHFAIIRILCAQMDIPLPTDFGYAPSTLHFQRSR